MKVTKIEIINRTEDTMVAGYSEVTEANEIREIQKRLARSAYSRKEYNTQANYGFIELVLIDKDDDKKRLPCIYTQEGQVIKYDHIQYENDSLFTFLRANY